MDIKTVVARQLREEINAIRGRLGEFQVPRDGWLKTVRKALCMSGAQIARRIGVTRAAISNSEKSEVEGSMTFKTMRQMASAMNCRFVYAIVPDGDVEEIMHRQARGKAKQLVDQAGVHMALEDQSLSGERMDEEVVRITQELLESPSSLWD